VAERYRHPASGASPAKVMVEVVALRVNIFDIDEFCEMICHRIAVIE
jgi:hypothetical protein